MKGNRRSCYSCVHSQIQCNENGRTIICYKSLRMYKPKKGKHYPEWCELEKGNGKSKEV